MSLYKTTLLVTLFAVLLLPIAPLYQTKATIQDDALGTLKQTGEEGAGFSENNLTFIIGRLIKVLLGLLGLIALIIIIVGGVKWMTSGGNEETITTAKKLMSNGIIGLLIIVIAYAAATFIIDKLLESGIKGPLINQPLPPGTIESGKSPLEVLKENPELGNPPK